jgi:hypothetical protein
MKAFVLRHAPQEETLPALVQPLRKKTNMPWV